MTRRAHVAAALAGLVVGSGARAARATEPAETNVELGHQFSLLTSGKVSRNLFYTVFRTKPVLSSNEETGSSWEFRLGARAAHDLVPDKSEVSIRDLSLVRRTEHVTATLGFQHIPWGETLGFPVADIVNPRDLRDPLFLDVDFVRLPVFAGNVQVTSGGLRVQAIVTPVPRSPMLPEAGSPFLPMGAPVLAPPGYSPRRLGRDAEAGGRISQLVLGWDLSAFFLTHMNRTPVFELVLAPDGSPALAPVFERVNTYGLSVTKPLGDRIIVRADSVLNSGTPRQSPTLGAHDRVLESQTVVQTDITADGDWMFSLQFQSDRQGRTNRQWASARVQKGFFDNRFLLAAYAFRGLNSDDVWVQPTVTWNFLDVCSLSVRGDFVWGTPGDPGFLGYFNDTRRVFTVFKIKL